MNWDNHPILYQLTHWWHWLTYGQNGATLGILLAVLVSALSVYVLFKTLGAVNRQAIASDRQAGAAEAQAAAARKQTEVAEQQRLVAERAANAAEEQLEAARAASKLAELQVNAARDSAMAEREHSDLIRRQALASLQPVLVFSGGPIKENPSYSRFYFENHGFGMALEVKVTTRKSPIREIGILHDIIGPGRTTDVNVDAAGIKRDGLQAKYKSLDGRRFVTVLEPNQDRFTQTSFQVNDKGGWIAQDTFGTATN
jgi:multidrug efflux pump subunit AcrA (membrane-fusion protein)